MLGRGKEREGGSRVLLGPKRSDSPNASRVGRCFAESLIAPANAGRVIEYRAWASQWKGESFDEDGKGRHATLDKKWDGSFLTLRMVWICGT